MMCHHIFFFTNVYSTIFETACNVNYSTVALLGDCPTLGLNAWTDHRLLGRWFNDRSIELESWRLQATCLRETGTMGGRF
jgi:hypothetical protein